MQNTNNLFSLAVQLWHYHKLQDTPSTSQYIVGLGSYDHRVAFRCAELYKDNFAPKIIFSGKFGNWTRGLFAKTEAEIFADYAISSGVEKKDIFIENESTNLGENIKFVKEFLLEREKIFPDKIIVVTKPNTERRAYATLKKVWPEINFSVTSPLMDFAQQTSVSFCTPELLINEMVGDLQRIKIYPNLGFQIHQEIPGEIIDVYKKLISMGFDKHLLKSKNGG